MNDHVINEAEKALLGALLLRPEEILEVADKLEPEQFSSAQHKAIYSAICSLDVDGEGVDPISVATKLAGKQELDVGGGESYVSGLLSDAPMMIDTKQYIKIITQAAGLRHILNVTRRATASVEQGGEPGDIAATLVSEVSKGALAEQDEVWLKDVLMEMSETGHKPMEGTLTTGITRFDSELGGWHPGELILIAARTSVGKTALALQLANHIAGCDKALLFVTLEMSNRQLAERLLASETEVSTAYFRNPNEPDMDLSRVGPGYAKLYEYPFILTGTREINRLAAQAKRLKAQHDIAAIFVDYVQLMRSIEKTNRRHEEVGLISNGLKAIANNLEIPVIACTQANRDAANEPLQLHHLRESGSLEMDADIVLLLHEDGDDHVKVKVAKNRNGRAGSVVTFRFNKAYGIFTHVPTVDF